MASRSWSKVQAPEKEIIAVVGSFKPAGSGAPTAVTGKGVKSVVRSGAGSFTITLEDAYTSLYGSSVMIAMTSVADLKPQWGAVDVVTAKTLVLNVLAVATPTDIAANAANVVYFTLHLKNSTV